METSRQKTPGGTADHSVLGILMPAPIPWVLFPWHIADREESTKCVTPLSAERRNTVILDSRMITSPALQFT